MYLSTKEQKVEIKATVEVPILSDSRSA